jgi:hypothetical protein
VVRGEWPGHRSAVQRLQDRRLDLDETRAVEIGADRAHYPRAGDEHPPRLLVGDQVELAVAEACLDIVEAVELVGRWAQALGQQLEALHAQRQLAALGAEGEAVDADDVPEVELEQARHPLLAEDVDTGLQLDAPRAVVEVQEGHLALAAAGVQAPGHAIARVGVLAGGQVGVRGVHRAHRRDPRIRRRERIDAVGAKALELRSARREELGAFLVGHRGLTRRRSW